MGRFQIDLYFVLRSTDVARDVQVVVRRLDLLHLHAAIVSFDRLVWSLLIRLDDPSDVVVGHVVLPLEVGHGLRPGFEALRLHKVVQQPDLRLKLLDNLGGLVYEPDFARRVSPGAGEQGDRLIEGGLLVSEVEDVPIRLGGIERAVGAGKGLDQAVMPEVLVDVERVQVLAVKAGQQHVDDNGQIDFLAALLRQIPVLDWQRRTAAVTVSCRRFKRPHGFSNVDEDEDWAEKYNQDQEHHYRRKDSAENPPRCFVFKNPPRRFQYRDYTVKAGDAG